MTAVLTVLVRSPRSWWPRLRGRFRWSARADAGFALTCCVLGQIEVATGDDGAGAVRALCVALATLPIAWRARAPLAAMVPVAASWVIFHVWGGFVGEPYFEITALVVIYSLGAHPVFSRAAGGMATLLVAVAVTDIRDLGFFGMLFALVWVSGQGVRTYRFQAAQLRASALELRRERGAHERLAVAQERQRMAFELHDLIADSVRIMTVQAKGAENMVSDEPDRARAALATVQDTGRAVIAQLHQVLRLLRDSQQVPGSGADSPALAPAPVWWGRRLVFRSIWADVLLALFVGLLADPQMTHLELLRGIPLPVTVSSVVAFVTVVIRRRVPLAALVIATTTTVVGLLLFGTTAGFASIVAVLLAMYSMAAQLPTRRSVPAAVAVAVAIAVVVILKIGVDGAAIFVVWLGVPWFGGRHVRTYQRRAEQLRTLTTRLKRERDARARLAVLEERARVARELHDSLAHAINVMVLQAGAAEQLLLSSPERAREATRTVESHGRLAHDDLRRLFGLFDDEVRGVHIPKPSLSRLDALFAGAGVPVTLKVSGCPAGLPERLDISAYRIIQEGLTNTLKHAGPVPTRVVLEYGAEVLTIEIRNQGIGRPAQPAGEGGHGLLGMRERAMLNGGVLETSRGADGGFIVRVLLPFTTPIT